MALAFSQACENNKNPIAKVLDDYLTDQSLTVLELGSYTAQHAVFFAQRYPKLLWQSTDQEEYLSAVEARLLQHGQKNNLKAFALEVGSAWPATMYDAVFTANTCHIMAKEKVADLFSGGAACLNASGHLFIYGPFKYNGQFTSESNHRFESWLTSNDSCSGIRDIEYLMELAEKNGLALIRDESMPANNQLLVFIKNE